MCLSCCRSVRFGCSLGALPQPARLCAALMYGGGLRVAECLSLRVKEMDLDRREIVVRG